VPPAEVEPRRLPHVSRTLGADGGRTGKRGDPELGFKRPGPSSRARMACSFAPGVRCMYRFVTAMDSWPISSASTLGGCPRIATCEQNVWRSV
jgi:hypothetical protein